MARGKKHTAEQIVKPAAAVQVGWRTGRHCRKADDNEEQSPIRSRTQAHLIGGQVKLITTKQPKPKSPGAHASGAPKREATLHQSLGLANVPFLSAWVFGN
jgi:hypothetical protein